VVSHAHQFQPETHVLYCTSSPAQQLGSCHARSSSKCRSLKIPTRLKRPGVLPEADLGSETCSNTSPQISPLKGQPKTRGRQYHKASPLRQSPERMNSTLLLLRRVLLPPQRRSIAWTSIHIRGLVTRKVCKILFLHKDRLQQVYYPPLRFDSALGREYLVLDLRHGVFRILCHRTLAHRGPPSSNTARTPIFCSLHGSE
jgi:hypothetical protein